MCSVEDEGATRPLPEEGKPARSISLPHTWLISCVIWLTYDFCPALTVSAWSVMQGLSLLQGRKIHSAGNVLVVGQQMPSRPPYLQSCCILLEEERYGYAKFPFQNGYGMHHLSQTIYRSQGLWSAMHTVNCPSSKLMALKLCTCACYGLAKLMVGGNSTACPQN